MSGAHPLDTGERCDLREKFVDEMELGWHGIEFVGQRDVEVDGVCGVKAGVNVKDIEHAADEQSRSDEQGEAESGLRHDERVLKTIPVAARGGIEATFS